MRLFRIILLAAVAMICCNAQAQTAAQVNASQKKMLAAATPCNQGAEPFSKFIEKFNTDPEFLDSRLKITDDERVKYADILKPGNFEAKTPFAKDDDEYYQMWGELQRNKAYLDCGWVDSYVTHTFEFIRVGEKWYLGKVVPGE